MGEKGSPRGKGEEDRNCRRTPKEEPSSSAEERRKRSTRKRANRASTLKSKPQKGRHPPIQPSWAVAEEKERESPETGTGKTIAAWKKAIDSLEPWMSNLLEVRPKVAEPDDLAHLRQEAQQLVGEGQGREKEEEKKRKSRSRKRKRSRKR